MRDAATMTKAPGASVYMPPEAIAPAESNDEKSKYDASIDVFSLGVVTIFTVGETFPCDPLAATYFDEERGMVIGRTELQRRSEYMRNVNTKLSACGQLRGDHPLIRLIQQCLHNSARKRPNIREVLGLLEEARAGVRDEESERNKVELVRALQNQPRNQNLVQLIDDLVTENAELQQQLSRKEADLTRAEETIRRKEQQIRKLETEKGELAQAKDRELAQQLRQLEMEKDELVQAKDRELAQARQQLKELEQSSKRDPMQRQLQSSEAQLDDTLQNFEMDEPPPLPPRNYDQSDVGSIFDTKMEEMEQIARGKLTVKCHTKKLPSLIWGIERGSAVTDDQFAYFTPRISKFVFRYEWSTEKWVQLAPSPCGNFGLAIIDGALTAVGGEDEICCTKKLFTLREGRWVEHYPAMNTASSSPAVVSTSDESYMFVIGGWNVQWTATVKLFHVKSRKWYHLTALPKYLVRPSATICDNQLNVIGEDGDGYMCSLQALDQLVTSQSKYHTFRGHHYLSNQ